MYVTSASQWTELKALAFKPALEILYKKEDRKLVTRLKTLANTENVYKIEKSSLSGPTFIGDIESNGQKIIPVQMLMSGQGKRLLEIVAYTESKFLFLFSFE